MYFHLKFEFHRLFGEKKNLFFLLLIFLFAGHFTFSGLTEYQRFLQDKKLFLQFEKEKSKQFATYMQYAAVGFRIIYQAGPLNIFFTNSNVLQNIESNIDATEILRADNPLKGKNLFLSRGSFKDFAGIIFLFGSLLMLYLGSLTFRSSDYLRFVMRRFGFRNYFSRTLLARLLWLDLAFAAMAVVLYFGVRLVGISFSSRESFFHLLFCLYVLFFLNFFYLLGALVSIGVKFSKSAFFWILIVWLVTIFLIPEIGRLAVFNQSRKLESSEKVNLEKLATLMEFENRFYDSYKNLKIVDLTKIREVQKKLAYEFLSSGYLVNSAREKQYLQSMARIISSHQSQSLLFPTTWYLFLGAELSGKGYHGFLDFMEHIIALRNQFMHYFYRKRYDQYEQKVESFVKADENIFKARSFLPPGFWIGFLNTLLYSLLVAAAGFIILRRNLFRE